MFARNISFQLKPDTLTQFTQTLENDVLPLLRKQKGFQDELTLSIPGGTNFNSISLWDTKENAEAYDATAYSEVIKLLSKVIEGTPKVRTSDVIQSTMHKHAAGVKAPFLAKPVAVAV